MKDTPSHTKPSIETPSNLCPLEKWLESMGLTRTTGYRYRKQGLITGVNVFGRIYVTREEIEAFERKAINGEFCREAKTPARRERVTA